MIERVMSGMRTTHRLHMGNYFGALKNWIGLQKKYPCFFGAMNIHSLTDSYKTSDIYRKYNREIIVDWLAFGIDPKKSVIFVQSEVPQILELNMIFTMITPMGWLERVTTWKDAEEELKQKDAYNLGRFAYPVLQAADIAVFKGTKVPVGKDQVPHLEVAREIVRRLNFLYKTQVPEPEQLLTETPAIPGTDGRKMSKSYGNVIPLLDEPEAIEKIAKVIPTDPARVRRTDKGNPEVCPVFSYHKLFTGGEQRKEINQGCRTAALGCADCKMMLAGNINAFMKEPLRKRKDFLNNPRQLDEIIEDGCKRARIEAAKTMDEIKGRLGWNES